MQSTTDQPPKGEIPPPFLEVRVQVLDEYPTLTGLCAGYECGAWRAEALASHILEWLPDFCLSYEEKSQLNVGSAMRLIRSAARRVYATEKYQRRGEFGEILLHIVGRQVFQTIPAISKMFYKDSDNDTVKGFDSVHVLATGTGLELWLGEVKFYKDIDKAISAVVEELHVHATPNFLRRENAVILRRIEKHWPYADRLARLLDPNVSLDEVFDAVKIPVLLTYESETMRAHTRVTGDFVQRFEAEVKAKHGLFVGKGLPDVKIHLVLLPLALKKTLLDCLDKELRRWQ